MEESKKCCDIVIAVKIELNQGEGREDMCTDSATEVEGRAGLTGIERKTGKEKQRKREVYDIVTAGRQTVAALSL